MQHWAVTVWKDGEELVTIESNCLSGKGDLTDDDNEVIRRAGENLLGFANVCPALQQRASLPDEIPF